MCGTTYTALIQTYYICKTTTNPLKPKLIYMIYKNSVRTSKRTSYFTITKINWLMLCKGVTVLFRIIQNPLIQNAGVTDC
jgi:hypothetical protein